MCSFVVLVLGFYASVLAYQVTSPSESQAWTNSGAQTLTWQRVDTDPPSFAAILIHEVNQAVQTCLLMFSHFLFLESQ
jgi:hypothetical protein